MLKIILPLGSIGSLDGGIEIKSNANKHYKMTGNSKNLLIFFFPTKIITELETLKKDRNQIMMQLVPSKNWSFNKNLKDDQYKIEPKFPFFSYFFKGKNKPLMFYIFKKFKFEEYLIIFFPLILISGPFLTDLTITIIDLFFVIKILKKKKIKININKNYFFYALYFYSIVIFIIIF